MFVFNSMIVSMHKYMAYAASKPYTNVNAPPNTIIMIFENNSIIYSYLKSSLYTNITLHQVLS